VWFICAEWGAATVDDRYGGGGGGAALVGRSMTLFNIRVSNGFEAH
jgi:hypothetical protein